MFGQRLKAYLRGLGLWGLFAFFSLGVGLPQSQAKEDPCACPVIECPVCQIKVGESFYSEKCGVNRVRSCKKPKCGVNPNEAELKMCLVKNKMPIPDRLKKNLKAKKSGDSEAQVKFVSAKNGSRSVGVLVVSAGEAKVIRKKGREKKGRVGLKIKVGDTLKTGPNGKMKVVFTDKNVLTVTPDSRIKIARHEQSATKDSTLLHLMYGKIRSNVKKKYKGDEASHFRVKTAAAVAGVRGTDFVTSFTKTGKGEYSTQIQTLHGTVELGGSESDKKVRIGAEQKAVFVAQGVNRDLFSEEEIVELKAKGYLTPVYKMSEKEVRNLVKNTEYHQSEIERSTASEKGKKEAFICVKPAGKLNQCSWTCEGNKPGAKSCMASQSGVSCVRRRCNANGSWAEEYRLPSSYKDHCEPNKPVVGDCDY